MKAKKCMAVMLACLLSVSFTACGNKDSEDSQADNKGEWWDVSKENMDEEESTINGDTSHEKETSEVETETSSATDASSEPADTSGTSSKSGGNNQKNQNTSNGNNKTEKTPYENPDTPAMVYSPDVEIFGDKNIADTIAICTVSINGEKFSLAEETVDTLVSRAGIRQNTNYTYLNPFEENDKYDGIFWYGKGYGIYTNAKDEAKRFTGTHVFIEGLESTSVAGDVDPTVEGAYRIRSVYSSADATKNDFAVSYIGGIKVGTLKKDIEDKLGAGGITKGYTYYANQLGALVIKYDENEMASEIYLFVNYDDVPIEYHSSEEAPAPEATTPTESETEPVETREAEMPPEIPEDFVPPENPAQRVDVD